MTTKNEIRAWLEAAKKKGATHVVIVCDTFDHGDYPISVMPGTDPRKTYEEYNGANMQQVMEVYSMKRDINEQLAEGRAWHFD